MEEISEAYRKSKKMKCNLLHQLCCCFYKPKHHISSDNETKTTIKIKEPKSKFWRRLRNWLSKSEESETKVSNIKFDIFEYDEHDNSHMSVISTDDEETPKIEDNITVHKTTIYNDAQNSEVRNENIPCLNDLDSNDTVLRTTIDTNRDNLVNTKDPKKSVIYRSIFEGNVTVHRTTIYNNGENSENMDENITCLNSLDTDSEENDIKNLTHQTHTSDLITTPAVSISLASISLESNQLANKKCEIPKFYFPSGKKRAEQWNTIEDKISAFFQTLPNAQASKNHFDKITKLCDLPFYLKKPLFIACGDKENRMVKMSDFIKYWKDVWSNCSDMSAIFVRVLTHNTNVNVLTRDDFKILIQDVIDTHPGLRHLKSAPKFHSGYEQTVIASIFYEVNTSWSGKMNVMEIRRSKLIAVLNSLENEDSLKRLPSYFNYEQYFVIERIFWKLDRRKCSMINIHDLSRYNRYAISKRMLKRLFSGTVIKREEHADYDKTFMDYWDFVFFIRSEENKTHSRAIEYWFRCMDIDGDGYLSLFELEHFYDEQLERFKDMRMEGSLPPFKECISEILYMVNPKHFNKISLADLKSCKMTNLFFNTFFNIDKYIKYIELDPHESLRERKNTEDKSDWEVFIEKEYRFFKFDDLKKNKYRRKNYKR